MPSSDPLILGFDTSAAHCAAALLCGEAVLVERFEVMARGQAERLMLLLEDVLREAGHDWHDLTAIGVGIGPGNFTGIRISVAAARGLALGLSIPAIGVDGLAAMAEGSGDAHPCLPAPRGQVYFRDPQSGAPRLGMPEDLPNGVLVAEGNSGLDRVAKQSVYQISVAIARIALRKLQVGEISVPAPLYVKPADAAPPRDLPPRILDDA